MKKHLSAIVFSLLCVFGLPACSMPDWVSRKDERKSYATAPGQTGTYMPRMIETKEEKRTAARERRRKIEKKREVARREREPERDREPEPERERALEEDENFVARGGFR